MNHRDAFPSCGEPSNGKVALFLIAAILLPAIIFAPTLRSPLMHLDDRELYVIAGRTSESTDLIKTFAGHLDHDMKQNGRFRPLFILERRELSNLIDADPVFARLLPYLSLLATTAILFAIGRTLRLAPWYCLIFAWLTVLNYRGSEAWCYLAPQERAGMLFICFSLLAILRGTGSRRRWLWDVMAVATAAAAMAMKEAFVLTLGGVIAARFAVERLRAAKPWRTILKENINVIVAMGILGTADIILAHHALKSGTYSYDLIHHVTAWKGLKRVFRHMASSNAYLVPIVVSAVACLAAGKSRFKKDRPVFIAVAAVSLAWLIPTAALQVKVGSAVGRWIYPLTLAPAFANAAAFCYLREKATALWRRVLDGGMILWFVYCTVAIGLRVGLFYAEANLTQDVVKAVTTSTHGGGRVLVLADEPSHHGEAVELQGFIESMAGHEIRVNIRDRRKVSPDATDGFNIRDYNAVVVAPPWTDLPAEVFEVSDAAFTPVEFCRPFFAVKTTLSWTEELKATVAINKTAGAIP